MYRFSFFFPKYISVTKNNYPTIVQFSVSFKFFFIGPVLNSMAYIVSLTILPPLYTDHEWRMKILTLLIFQILDTTYNSGKKEWYILSGGGGVDVLQTVDVVDFVHTLILTYQNSRVHVNWVQVLVIPVRDGPGDAARLARPVKAPDDIPSSQFVCVPKVHNLGSWHSKVVHSLCYLSS